MLAVEFDDIIRKGIKHNLIAGKTVNEIKKELLN